MNSRFILSLAFLIVLLNSCKEKKGFTSEDFHDVMSSSIAKSFDDALKNPQAISSISVREMSIAAVPETIDNRFVNLIQLVLSDNNIKDLPASIGSISSLQYIQVNKNQLTSLPATFGNFHNLLTFLANMNNIEELPDVPFLFDNRATFDLRFNKISKLPESFAYSRLAHLYLSGNPLEELPENIGEMRDLRVLWLANTKISKIPTSFFKLQNLTNLDVRGTQLSLKQINEIKAKMPNCALQSDFE